MILMESIVSGHQFTQVRERLADKLELIRFDPYSKYKFIFFPISILTQKKVLY